MKFKVASFAPTGESKIVMAYDNAKQASRVADFLNEEAKKANNNYVFVVVLPVKK